MSSSQTSKTRYKPAGRKMGDLSPREFLMLLKTTIDDLKPKNKEDIYDRVKKLFIQRFKTLSTSSTIDLLINLAKTLPCLFGIAIRTLAYLDNGKIVKNWIRNASRYRLEGRLFKPEFILLSFKHICKDEFFFFRLSTGVNPLLEYREMYHLYFIYKELGLIDSLDREILKETFLNLIISINDYFFFHEANKNNKEIIPELLYMGESLYREAEQYFTPEELHEIFTSGEISGLEYLVAGINEKSESDHRGIVYNLFNLLSSNISPILDRKIIEALKQTTYQEYYLDVYNARQEHFKKYFKEYSEVITPLWIELLKIQKAFVSTEDPERRKLVLLLLETKLALINLEKELEEIQVIDTIPFDYDGLRPLPGMFMYFEEGELTKRINLMKEQLIELEEILNLA